MHRYNIPNAILCCFVLDTNLKFSQDFRRSKPKRTVTPFMYMCSPLLVPFRAFGKDRRCKYKERNAKKENINAEKYKKLVFQGMTLPLLYIVTCVILLDKQEVVVKLRVRKVDVYEIFRLWLNNSSSLRSE